MKYLTRRVIWALQEIVSAQVALIGELWRLQRLEPIQIDWYDSVHLYLRIEHAVPLLREIHELAE